MQQDREVLSCSNE